MAKAPSRPAICKNCRHWREDRDIKGEVGECQRYPPQVIMSEEVNCFSARPATEWKDTCGEFEAKHDA